MKHLLTLLILLLLCMPALADNAEDIAMAIHPGSTVSQRLEVDGTTLLVLTEGDVHTLLMLEGNIVTIDNANALLPGAVLPDWSFTSDVLTWTYRGDQQLVRYRSEKHGGSWGEVDVTVTTADSARMVSMDGQCLRQQSLTGGVLTELTPVPAPWLAGQTVLSLFRCDALPSDLSLLPAEAYQPAADLLADGYSVLLGVTCEDGLLLLVDKPNHVARQLVAAIWSEAARGYQVTRSTPITVACQGVPLENGVALIVGNCIYDVTLDISGCWAITGMHLEDGDVQLNAEHLSAAGVPPQHALWGSHPWCDIAKIDWHSLPRAYSEAAGSVNPMGWARVSNPDTADTLHLRQQPDTRAHSLGRYYNGAPMQMLTTSKDWVQVSIGGVTGWMMRDFVATDYAMQTVAAETPMKHVTSGDGSLIPLYADAHAQTAAAWLEKGERVLLLGFVGEECYHVLVPDRWLYGYVQMCDVK